MAATIQSSFSVIRYLQGAQKDRVETDLTTYLQNIILLLDQASNLSQKAALERFIEGKVTIHGTSHAVIILSQRPKIRECRAFLQNFEEHIQDVNFQSLMVFSLSKSSVKIRLNGSTRRVNQLRGAYETIGFVVANALQGIDSAWLETRQDDLFSHEYNSQPMIEDFHNFVVLSVNETSYGS